MASSDEAPVARLADTLCGRFDGETESLSGSDLDDAARRSAATSSRELCLTAQGSVTPWHIAHRLYSSLLRHGHGKDGTQALTLALEDAAKYEA